MADQAQSEVKMGSYRVEAIGSIEPEALPELTHYLGERGSFNLLVEGDSRLLTGYDSGDVGPIVYADEVQRFALRSGYGTGLATRAWNHLVDGFGDIIHGRDRLHFPVRFIEFPGPGVYGRWLPEDRPFVNGLVVKSLARLVQRIPSNPRHWEVRQFAGRNSGPRMAKFWRDLCKDQLGDVDTSTEND